LQRAIKDIENEFDAEFYARIYPDVVRLGWEPIEHYALLGWRQRRDPSPSFSSAAYLAAYPDVARLNVDPFRHYITHGRSEGRVAHPSQKLKVRRFAELVRDGRKRWTALLLDPKALWLEIKWAMRRKDHERQRSRLRARFDEDFYVTTYPEVNRLAFGPLRHFIVAGWKEGKDPSPMFSTTTYLQMYGDVAEQGLNPFYHFVMNGEAEGRIAPMSTVRRNAVGKLTTPLVVPPVLSAEEWSVLPRRAGPLPERLGVTVVVPVYRSLTHVSATLASVLAAHNDTAFECLVINDASPEPEVTALLRALAASGHIRLLENESNRGFVRTVNRGMAESAERDVVLLNADTEVAPGWLDRLVAPMRHDPTIATVTALSNNATIASYPNTAVDNPYELEVGTAALDRIASEVNGEAVVEVPTGVGFCMAIRRRALAELGDFDAETFGIGYGEECDFCMRALKGGWRNVVAPGVYVRHWGSTSFGASESTRSAAAQVLLAERHPDYKSRIGRYVAADPLLPARIKFDIGRLKAAVGPISILFVSHTRGGGIETFLDYERTALLAAGLDDVVARAVVMKTLAGGFVEFSSFAHTMLPYTPNLQVLNLERHKSLIAEVIHLLDPELVHVNTFAGMTQSAIRTLMAGIAESGRPYWHVWHDHQPLCPRLTFLDAEERYCGETDASRCTACLAASSTSFEWVRIDDWREDFRRYLAGAAHVSAPSEAAALRARRLAGVGRVAVEPHPEPQLTDVAPLARRQPLDGERRIVMLGALGPHKGAYLLHAMAKDAETRDLAIRLHVVGYTAVREMASEPKAVVHGRYFGDADAARRMAAIEPDLFFCSSVWPETYIFTLSVAMALGLPIVCFDIGAQAERVRAYGRGVVLPLELADDPGKLNEVLLGIDVDALWAAPVTVTFAAESALVRHFAPRVDVPRQLAATVA
jgi:GT2 family glycosyltransferase/glycosyltransferase involved in cell wall biosynthesis